jgi:hypothetical protein
VRQRLIGPQPYLIDPNDYFAIICCLVEKRYRPVKDALVEATAMAERGRDDQTLREVHRRASLPPSSEKDAKGAIPSVVNCCGPGARRGRAAAVQAR